MALVDGPEKSLRLAAKSWLGVVEQAWDEMEDHKPCLDPMQTSRGELILARYEVAHI